MRAFPPPGQDPGPQPACAVRPDRPASGASLWTEYWQEFCLENVPHERCHIPEGGRQAVDEHWARFADLLPPGAAVIDLGCGAGVVGRLLLARRNDLRVTGIDFANVPAVPADNLTIHRGVRMEALPFTDHRFDAAVSLFGIEYGDIEQAGTEMSRVLKPNARFSFLVHHVESEIVREGARRRRALLELLSAKVEAPFLEGSNAGLEEHVQRLRNDFPGEPSIKLFTDYLRHHVNRRREARIERWQNLLDGLGSEIALLANLERSAKCASRMGSWLVPLIGTMASVSLSTLRRSSGQPIAWQVDGIR